MPLDYHDLDRTAYEQLRFQLLANAEENGNAKYDSYPDGRGYPTIGYGFNLGDRAVREKVLGVAADGYRSLSQAAQQAEDAYVEELRLVLVELGNTADIWGQSKNSWSIS